MYYWLYLDIWCDYVYGEGIYEEIQVMWKCWFYCCNGFCCCYCKIKKVVIVNEFGFVEVLSYVDFWVYILIEYNVEYYYELWMNYWDV